MLTRTSSAPSQSGMGRRGRSGRTIPSFPELPSVIGKSGMNLPVVTGPMTHRSIGTIQPHSRIDTSRCYGRQSRPSQRSIPAQSLSLPLFVTEVSWHSSDGRISGPDALGTTEAGQAKRLLLAFRLFAEARGQLRLRRIYWYTWITRDSSSTDSGDYAGLLHLAPGGAVTAKPAFAAFARIVQRVRAGARAVQAPS
jgi:hypothetical protein